MQPNPPNVTRPSILVTIVAALLSSVLWCGLIAMLLYVTPLAMRVGNEIQVATPWYLRQAATISMFLLRYPPLLVMPAALVLLLVGGTTAFARHRLRRPALGVAWCVAMIVLPIVAAGVTWYGVVTPTIERFGELNLPKAGD